VFYSTITAWTVNEIAQATTSSDMAAALPGTQDRLLSPINGRGTDASTIEDMKKIHLVMNRFSWLRRLSRFSLSLAHPDKSKLFQDFTSAHRTTSASEKN